jgi:HNH endonuclease
MLSSLQATKAPQRCWEMYKQCCITGRGPLLQNDVIKPPDIIACHIFPHAYRDAVSTFLDRLSAELISGQWVASEWSKYCTDSGPDDKCSHKYTGYHQICCLNNMIPLRSDVHALWDAYEIEVDVSVSAHIH